MIKEMIKNKRKEFGLTQEALAEKLNVSRTTISSWETGRTYPDLDRVVELSEFFDVSLDYLLKGNEITVKKITKDSKKGRILNKIGILFLVFILLTGVYFIIWKAKVDNLYKNISNNGWTDEKYYFSKVENSVSFHVPKLKTYKIWELPESLDLTAEAMYTSGDESYINGVSIDYTGDRTSFLVSWGSRDLSGVSIVMDSDFEYKKELQDLTEQTLSYEFEKIYRKELDIERTYLIEFLELVDGKWKKINLDDI